MLDSLSCYLPTNQERQHLEDIRDLIKYYGRNCFYRTHFNPGHITGSGLLTSADGTRVLMNHHKFLNIWICFGGHADGETDVLQAALREVIEESGIQDVEPVSSQIFDVDVHSIPENPLKAEPCHKHFDVRYLFRVSHPSSENFVCSDESNSMRWCGFDEALSLVHTDDESMRRLLHKWNNSL